MDFDFPYDDQQESERQYDNVWGKAYGLDQRGRHKSFGSALDVVLKDLLTEHNDFYTTLADQWQKLFPTLPAKPGRYEDGKIFLYVRTAPMLFMMRPKLRMIKSKLAKLPNAPKKIDLHLEIHAQ